ncbi:methionine ABC transporter ATP-binding protein [Patulibacter defluvii]|uniref:methionine ABC transporter ATP-binding protein n=1 Tax=Patulibacter defluvii TaxID=3095358 RepID=UPI002A75A62A|nr:ATP-binding cassette domain-containing protein [Patulibacter sp. DM4]
MIQVESLRKTFRRDGHDVVVLDDVSLTVEAGRIAGVIGPSGAGKSTLARTINLLERPTSGTVVVAGQELTRLRERELQAARRRIGTIFQSASLLSARTVSGNVALPLELAGIGRAERRRRVAELVERVGLTHHADAYPAQLSGGQRQRVGIARALALRPDVLLSDEATSGLDPETTRTILALLRELRDDLGLTILLITHEMDVVRDVCDEVTLLRDGRVVESGPLQRLVTTPDSVLGRGLVPERPIGAAGAGRESWRIGYARADVDPAWLATLQAELDAPIELLGAAVEAIDGRPAGHVTIALPAGGPDLRALLAGRGLDARRIDGDAAAAAADRLAAAAAGDPLAVAAEGADR